VAGIAAGGAITASAAPTGATARVDRFKTGSAVNAGGGNNTLLGYIDGRREIYFCVLFFFYCMGPK